MARAKPRRPPPPSGPPPEGSGGGGGGSGGEGGEATRTTSMHSVVAAQKVSQSWRRHVRDAFRERRAGSLRTSSIIPEDDEDNAGCGVMNSNTSSSKQTSKQTKVGGVGDGVSIGNGVGGGGEKDDFDETRRASRPSGTRLRQGLARRRRPSAPEIRPNGALFGRSRRTGGSMSMRAGHSGGGGRGHMRGRSMSTAPPTGAQWGGLGKAGMARGGDSKAGDAGGKGVGTARSSISSWDSAESAAGPLRGSGLHRNLRERIASATCLVGAASEGNAEAVRSLLTLGEDLNKQRWADGYTALHGAIEGGHRRIVHLLLDLGTKTGALDCDAWCVCVCVRVCVRACVCVCSLIGDGWDKRELEKEREQLSGKVHMIRSV